MITSDHIFPFFLFLAYSSDSVNNISVFYSVQFGYFTLPERQQQYMGRYSPGWKPVRDYILINALVSYSGWLK